MVKLIIVTVVRKSVTGSIIHSYDVQIPALYFTQVKSLIAKPRLLWSRYRLLVFTCVTLSICFMGADCRIELFHLNVLFYLDILDISFS